MSSDLERFDPHVCRGRIAYEHLHRYTICSQFAEGMRTLDLACGTGYGSAILAGRAAQVVGLDIDQESIRRANAGNNIQNLSFVCGDAYRMPFEDGQFDLVIANEMIEHVSNHDSLLQEIKRVLTPRGKLLVSTPNKSIYNRYKKPNEFHISEMERHEFSELLETHFANVKLIGQRMALLSAAFGLGRRGGPRNQNAAETFIGRYVEGLPDVSAGSLALKDPEYLIGLCSDALLDDSELNPSIFAIPSDDLWLEHEKVMNWASGVHNEDEVLRGELARLHKEAADRQTELDVASAKVELLDERLKDAKRATSAEAALFDSKIDAARESALAATRIAQRERDEIERQLADLRAKADEHARLIAGLVREFGSDVGDGDQIDVVASLFSLQRSILSKDLRMARLEEEKKRLERQASDVATELASREKAISKLRDDLAKYRQEIEESRATSEQAEQRALAAQRQAQAEIVEAERRVRDAQQAMRSWEHQLGFAKSHADLISDRHDASLNVRKSLARDTKWLKLPWAAMRKSYRRNKLFDRGFIGRNHPELEGIGWRRFVSDPQLQSIDPHPLFSSQFYLEQNPEVAGFGVHPLLHYLAQGWKEGRSPNPYFDNDWYLSQNPDVLDAGVNPLVHYVEHGQAEGRSPNPIFDAAGYRSRNPDVQREGMDPFIHWVGYGDKEGRTAPLRKGLTATSGLPREANIGGVQRYLLQKNRVDFPTLSGTGEFPPSRDRTRNVLASEWPPAHYGDYWLPQTLRDVIVDRHGEDWVAAYHTLFAVMDDFQGRPDEYATSTVGKAVLARISKLANAPESRPAHEPDASIIVPVYNNFLDTSLCILSLLESHSTHSFEIIVADDGSSDSTRDLVAEIGGCVRYVRQSRNLGFLGNCNAAVKQAKGQFIVLLNNDTIVLPGWLDALLKPMNDERIGLVGSKLINWDGSLQEAGGIFWKDGSAWNYGRNQDARDPIFNFVRDVDYVSGASIAVPRRVWDELGGFDIAYAPAYCEDSDLAFRIREAGHRTIYQPESEVVHHEGRSHGRDLNAGVKAYQVENQKRLYGRWRRVLERDHFDNGSNVWRARDRSNSKRHVLVVDHYVPQWDRDAGSRTMQNFMMTLLSMDVKVTFWPDNLNYDEPYVRALQQMGVEVIHGWQFVGKFREFLEARNGLYDTVLLSRPHIASCYIDDVRSVTDAVIAYYGHDVHYLRMETQKETGSNVEQVAIDDMRDLELGVCRQCDVIMYPSQTEIDHIRGQVGSDKTYLAVPMLVFDDHQIEEGMRKAGAQTSLGQDILFVGGFAHHPNVDGLIWFAKEIMPKVLAELPAARLKVAGSNPPPEIQGLNNDSIEILGYVTDDELERLYDQAQVAIAPLRYGAGVKGKVIEAMSKGVPVVTTSIGAQGIPGAETMLFIADDVDDFVQAVRDAISDKPKSKRKANAAVEFLQQEYSINRLATFFVGAMFAKSITSAKAK